ncbi:MAG: hypothetical protein ACRD43_04455 [Pyrinomonadaceae bacterium]
MKQGFIGVIGLCAAIMAAGLFAGGASGQVEVDKSVAVVSDGVRSELITYSDLLWQLALEPKATLDSPSSEDLNRALQTQINQRLFTLEAERVPREAPTEKEINIAITELVSRFSSPAEFESRLRKVGFTSVKDPHFERIIVDRLSIEKYLDFRFRSFIVITPEDETKYYSDIFIPNFRRQYPGVLTPSLDEKRADIRNTLTEEKVASAIETFLDDAKRRVQIVILNEV